MIAVSRSSVVDMKAPSMPPRTLYRLGVQNLSGSVKSCTPRYTVDATVSLLSLTIAELSACSVVVYLLTRRMADSNAVRVYSRSAV